MTGTVHAFRPDTPAGIAAPCMNSRGFTAAAVTDDAGSLIGIVTAIDLSTATGTGTATHAASSPQPGAPCPPVRDLAVTPGGTVTPGADIADIVALMLHKEHRRLPTVDGHTVVGVITPPTCSARPGPRRTDSGPPNPASGAQGADPSTPLTIGTSRRPTTMNDPHIDVLSGHRALFDPSEQAGAQRSSTPGTAPRIRIEPRPNPNARVGKVTLRQRIRRAIAVRELRRLVRDAPTATIRNDLLTIAARNERPGR